MRLGAHGTRGLLAGVLGGIAASLAMDVFQRALAAAMQPPRPPNAPEQDEPATAKLAHRIAVATTGHRVPETYGPAAGQAVHYATGAVLGAVYGVLAEAQSATTAGAGTAYAAVTWAAIDEGLVPALRLGPPPAAAPLGEHVYSLASHLVYGVVLELTRRALRDRL